MWHVKNNPGPSRRACSVRRWLAPAVLGAALALPGVARGQQRNAIRIELPEAYELANIILAITPYGRTDKWEVQQGTPYYREVIAHFLPFAGHPLIAKANYSRERWAEYLSFRSDAYAFRFDSAGHLARVFPFEANDGIRPFDDLRAEVEDFARVSGFREFYRAHADYYSKVGGRYERSYLIPESIAFLEREFGPAGRKEFRVVLSPLVYRMNAQRSLGDTVTLSLATPAAELLGEEDRDLDPTERLEQVHTLFTEVDHAFVNPVTERHASLLNDRFAWQRWNGTKDEYADNASTFNEYMTWAVYDLFARERFGPSARDILASWHLQNKSRGFLASELFAAELVRLRGQSGRPVRELYPAMLAWTKRRQETLTVPRLISPVDSIDIPAAGPVRIRLEFSEPMVSQSRLAVIPLTLGPNGLNTGATVTINAAANQLHWSKGNRVLEFDWTRPGDAGLLLNWWGATPVSGRSGVYLAPQTVVLFRRR